LLENLLQEKRFRGGPGAKRPSNPNEQANNGFSNNNKKKMNERDWDEV
jgi:hypothetical protein